MHGAALRQVATSALQLPDMPSRGTPRAGRRFRSGWQARGVSHPATAFSGDFYTALEVDDDLWFALGDFSGHGLGAAIFTAMVQEELERVIDHDRNDCVLEIVASIDRTMREEFPSNRFASLVVGRAGRDGRVVLVNAGHPPPLVVRADGRAEGVPATGPVVGIVPAPRWGSVCIDLGPGDGLLLYTDGLPEARDATDEEFGFERIAETAIRSTLTTAIDTLVGEVGRFTGGRREDDLTIFVLSR